MILVYLELYLSLKIKGCIKLREYHDRFAPSLGLAGLNTRALPNRVHGCPCSLLPLFLACGDENGNRKSRNLVTIS
jgi:hypothetical protein